MKALSLWNPWAHLLASGKKQCETRSWPMRHRGPLLIHAAKRWNSELCDVSRSQPFRAALEAHGVTLRNPTANGKITHPSGMSFGAIIGRVDVIDCWQTHTAIVSSSAKDGCYGHKHRGFETSDRLFITPTEHAFGDYSPGRFVFLCARPVLFERPIPYAGLQSLFDVPDELLENNAPSGRVPGDVSVGES